MKTIHKTAGYFLSLCFSLLVAPVSFADPAKEPGTMLTVMSFNIRTVAPEKDLRDNWPFRKKHVLELILEQDPEVLGLQEVTRYQLSDLAHGLPGYGHFGLPRRDGKTRGERCTIFYKQERLELQEHGTFWLSETPDVPGSRGWDAAFPRVVTWGKFKDKNSAAEFYLFNTHFDHQGATARSKSAKLVLEKIASITHGAPAVLMGDFNTSEDSEPYQVITSLLQDGRKVSESPPAGPQGTSRGFELDAPIEERIDYIFITTGITVKNYTTLDNTYDQGRRPSDHLPVKAALIIPR